MNLNNVTVVIPAHNRPDRLRRLLDYYSTTNLNIVVPDSSREYFKYASEFPRVAYLHFPEEHFLVKINKILSLINTPYVLYCADDDFIVPSAILGMVKFLENNSDYESAQGHYLTFGLKGNKIDFSPRYIRNFYKDIDQELPSQRIKEFRNMYAPNLYSVIRTDTFKKMYLNCIDGNKLKFRNLFLAEIYFIIFSLINGKHKTLPVFYSAREQIRGSATETTAPISIVLQREEYKNEVTNFTEILANHLKTNEELTYEESKAKIIALINSPAKDPINKKKRKIINVLKRFDYFHLFSRMIEKRYKNKGIKATRGMSSYPCTFSTPDKEQIISSIVKYL